MMKYAAVVLCCALLCAPKIAAQDAPSPPEKPAAAVPDKTDPAVEQQRRIIRYGTDTEIANLIKTLRSDNASEGPLDGELLEAAEKTKNRAILLGVFGYFGDREKSGLEERALRVMEDRDYEAAETVNAAIDYLGKLKAAGAGESLKAILDGEETRFLPAALRALGRTAEKDNPGETAEYLIDYYTNREPGDENRRLIVAALGDLKAKEGTAFLVTIAENEDERAPLRITAAEALAKIADPAGLSALISAASSKDPNVRSSAVGSLGPFTGEAAEAAIIEAFRDSYYRTRIAAAKAAGERKLAAAVPFLRFRAENDDVPTVRDEAVKALGAIDGSGSEEILLELFKERKNSDRIRISAGEMLLARGNHAAGVIAELEEAKAKNQTALYNGFLRILGNAKAPELENLARRFFSLGGVIEKSYALDISGNNDFRSLAGEVRKLTDPKNGSLSRKSLALLEKWGLPAEEPAAVPTEEAATTEPAPADAPEGTAAAEPATALPEDPASARASELFQD